MKKKEITYKQCRLQNGNRTLVSWIPSKFAKIGRLLELKGEDGWEVLAVGSVEMNQGQVTKMRNAHKNHRKATDV